MADDNAYSVVFPGRSFIFYIRESWLEMQWAEGNPQNFLGSYILGIRKLQASLLTGIIALYQRKKDIVDIGTLQWSLVWATYTTSSLGIEHIKHILYLSLPTN